MKRFALGLFGLMISLAFVGCCGPCGNKCGTGFGTSFFGPSPVFPSGGCPGGNCGINGAAAPAQVLPQGAYIPPSNTQAFAAPANYSYPTTAQNVIPAYNQPAINQTAAAVPMQTMPTY